MTVSTAVDLSAVARVVGIATKFVDLRQANILLLPQHLGVIGQGSSAVTYSTDKRRFTSAFDVATVYGFGSPLHLASRQIFPVNGTGVGTIPVTFHPLVDDGSGVVSDGDITPSGTQTTAASYVVRVNNIDSAPFVVAVSATVAAVVTAMTTAINAVVEMPIIAADGTTVLTFTSKWQGASANDIFVEVVGIDFGTTFTITQANGGLNNPDIAAALAQIGNVWESMLVNCLETADSAALDELSSYGEGVWGALIHQPIVAFTGTTEASQTTAIVIPDARKTDRVNSQLVAPGSNDLPLVVAASQAASIISLANNNPPHDYGGRPATGLTPGTDAQQWDYPERDAAVKGGSSTVEVVDGVVNISDVVTFFHPTGDPIPAYRFVVDIVKLQNVLFTISLIFNSSEWDGAPLIPDPDPTNNSSAKKPKSAKTAINTKLDGLGLAAIISDPATAKTKTVTEIDSGNPKRLNARVVIQLAGNAGIISVDLDFGFFFGTPALAA